MQPLDYDRVKELETYRTEYGTFTVVRLVNKNGAITWLKLYQGKVASLPHWLKPAKLEADYQAHIAA